jgi:uncharacterized protein
LTPTAGLHYDDFMRTAVFSFHPELEFFLPRSSRGAPLALSFDDHQTIKHLIESSGVPHVEVGKMDINGFEVDFHYKPRGGDRITVFPSEYGRSTEPRLAADGHLGRLAAYLRMLGVDTYYETQVEDSRLAPVAVSESRILLSRDRRLLMHKSLERGYCPRSLQPIDQLQEVLNKFNLWETISPFKRCIQCNGILHSVEKEEVADELLPLTRRYFEEFSKCQECRKVYWKGSHYERMQRLIDRIHGWAPKPQVTDLN